MISASSRYAGVKQGVYLTTDGRSLPYLRRRMIPSPNASAVLTTVKVAPGTRLDLIAAKLQGDPLQAWRLADANGAMDPTDLTSVPGRVLAVPKPGG